ncbi:MAG: DUF502 domain-containing protein [Candidatus Omnitrophota bacterium]|nr:DUF502 domain-containing protein [Candidatus Omnitrophota bacterium]
MKKTWNKFLVYFINGVVLLLPIVLTVVLIKFLALQVNNIVLDPIMKLFTPVVMGLRRIYVAKTLIFLLVILAIAIIGWAAKILFIKRFFSHGEKLFIKVPILGRIYNAAKQIFSALLGQGKTIFREVVMLEYPRKGIYSIGFTTGDAKGEINQKIGKECLSVFVPTTPNPTSGLFLVVPKEEVFFLKMSVEDGMKLVISGGSFSPCNEIGESGNIKA